MQILGVVLKQVLVPLIFFRKEAGVQCYCNGLLTKVMSSSRFGIIWQEIKPIDLDVADDLALLTNECKQVQLMTDSLTN